MTPEKYTKIQHKTTSFMQTISIAVMYGVKNRSHLLMLFHVQLLKQHKKLDMSFKKLGV